jgi:hypothetical protein
MFLGEENLATVPVPSEPPAVPGKPAPVLSRQPLGEALTEGLAQALGLAEAAPRAEEPEEALAVGEGLREGLGQLSSLTLWPPLSVKSMEPVPDSRARPQGAFS